MSIVQASIETRATSGAYVLLNIYVYPHENDLTKLWTLRPSDTETEFGTS